MHAIASASNTEKVDSNRQSHTATFAKVTDGRKLPIRGLWSRNGKFYAQLSVEDPNTGARHVRRVPLVDKNGAAVQTVAQARAELDRLRTQRADDALPCLRQTPKFKDYRAAYLDFIRAGSGTKRPATIAKEASALGRWAADIGELRLDKIRKPHVAAFIQKRLIAGMAPRTVNLDVGALRCCLKKAQDDGWIQSLPMSGMRPLRTNTPKRTLFTNAELDRLCDAAPGATKNAQELVDYLRVLAYSGARRNEALALRWADVDFERGQLTIGAAGDTKNRKARVVDFNAKLDAHLRDMHRRRPPSQWLFPSPQRGDKDIPARSFRESLHLACHAAGIRRIHFHDLRHLFVSYCVMSGVDFMTIARWAGHQDGGVLIGRVYGHLADTHTKAQAARVNFGPVLLDDGKAVQE